MTRMPEVLAIIETALGLDPVVNVPVPGAVGLEQAGSRNTVGTFEDETSRGELDPRRATGEPLAVHVAPGAERVELEAYRTRSAHDSVGDRHRGAPAVNGDLSLDGHVADGPPPPR